MHARAHTHTHTHIHTHSHTYTHKCTQTYAEAGRIRSHWQPYQTLGLTHGALDDGLHSKPRISGHLPAWVLVGLGEFAFWGVCIHCSA